MAKPINAADLKRFWDDREYWVEGLYTDDMSARINGGDQRDDLDIDSLHDSDTVVFTSGFIAIGRETLQPSHPLYKSIDKGVDVEKAFLQWQKKQTISSMVVEFDHSKISKEQLVEILLKLDGVKVLA